ncbi:(deoxy)nucleoside triphosphate pyrophosphohydrolase [Anditalea andensis]|uniref:8-oxo-dGTP diphosphatase n=1 Tax=Anditalea andensis TaxID=1048983 RepID=A0A074LD13_9BACT|nr:(deoxy)nucleoside triphosphate pyrophosphohydrolase [Anditalea andensis]KEO71657.1 hypothetical protein EL17_23390 [Anditalea andensis]
MIKVTCAIIIKHDLILAVQRSGKMKMPFKWEFPGGKVEEQEDETLCIQREIKEELNVEIRILDRLSPATHDYGTFTIQLIPFIATIISGELLLQEHQAHRWLTKDELWDLDWAEADVPVVQEFLTRNT